MALDVKVEPDSLVLRQLRGIRQEMAAILENQARDRQLILRIVEKMDGEAIRMDEGIAALRRDIAGLRSDVLLLENKLLTRHNEILDLARRVDDPELSTP